MWAKNLKKDLFMQRIQSVGTVDALPEPEFSGRPGYFFGGDPTTGKQATVVTADWLNMVQEELLAVVTGAGLEPDALTQDQVLQAIRALVVSGAATVMKGATESAKGASGLVPEPPAGSVRKPLGGGGTFLDVADIDITGKADNAEKWSGAGKRVSAASPSGGNDGDVWFQYLA